MRKNGWRGLWSVTQRAIKHWHRHREVALSRLLFYHRLPILARPPQFPCRQLLRVIARFVCCCATILALLLCAFVAVTLFIVFNIRFFIDFRLWLRRNGYKWTQVFSCSTWNADVYRWWDMRALCEINITIYVCLLPTPRTPITMLLNLIQERRTLVKYIQQV